MKNLLFTATALLLLLSACGGGDGPQGEVADILLDPDNIDGLELNEDCVRENTAQLTDEDAQALVDAGIDGDPTISAAGTAVNQAIFDTCVDADSYRALVIKTMAEDGDFDASCFEAELEGLTTVGEIDDALADTALKCLAE